MTVPTTVEGLRQQIDRCRRLARVSDEFTARALLQTAEDYEQRLRAIIKPQDAVLLPNKMMG